MIERMKASDFNIVFEKEKNLFVFIINIVVKAWRVFAKDIPSNMLSDF